MSFLYVAKKVTDQLFFPIAEPPLNRITRRKSVFAEAYNPEEEEDEAERVSNQIKFIY